MIFFLEPDSHILDTSDIDKVSRSPPSFPSSMWTALKENKTVVPDTPHVSTAYL
jgi:hypothetical protein